MKKCAKCGKKSKAIKVKAHKLAPVKYWYISKCCNAELIKG